jgi:predicted patatin/cPLA2 family phospholipase
MVTHIRFNGAGGHYSYLLGIASVLQTNYDLKNVLFSGYSAGCIPAVLLCVDLEIEKEVYNINYPVLEKISMCVTKAYFNFIPCLKEILNKRFNEVSNLLYLRANNKMHCNLTHIPSFKNHVYKKYNSNSDLIDCMLASGHVPFYNKNLFYTYNNKYYVDGGLSKMLNRDELFNINGEQLLEIKTTMFRDHLTHFIFISSSTNDSNYLYNLGKKDAYNNLKYFDMYLTRRINSKM